MGSRTNLRTLAVCTVLIVGLQAVAPRIGHTANACDNPQNSYDATYCKAKLFIEADEEMNGVYKALRSKLDKTGKEELRQIQLKWLEYRNFHCERMGTINVECNFVVVKSRTDYLRDRLRECEIGYCSADKIRAKSWD